MFSDMMCVKMRPGWELLYKKPEYGDYHFRADIMAWTYKETNALWEAGERLVCKRKEDEREDN